MQKMTLDNYDESVLLAIVLSVDSPIDWKEVILNYFFFQKSVIWYESLNSSIRNLVAANFLIQNCGDLTTNAVLAKELRDIQRGTHADYTSTNQLYSQNPISQERLAELPENIISEEEFEEAMAKFYEFIIRYMPHKLAPRMVAEDMLLIEGTSTDPTYGTTIENPINVGGFAMAKTSYIHLYFKSLIGENGNPITYRRIGPCLELEVPPGRSEGSLVDMYAVQIEGEPKAVGIYINMYDCRLPLKAPMGFVGKVLG